MLLFATNVLWKTTNGGQSWDIISPDLSNERPDLPESIGSFRTDEMKTMDRRGVIYAVAPSPLDVGSIWAGTDDGLVHVTHDGGQTWQNVTPGALRAWDKVSQIDAGHFDTQTAYLAINAIRRDDMQPHIYRTHDGGATWTRIVYGLPENGPVNVVREDPKQPGLLFAGTEREVYFSIDDGENWQTLRKNMPASSIRDLVVHEDDLVIGTHGRSIWILDNIAPLREMARAIAADGRYLFTPPLATRVRWNMFSDTPMPPEEPTGQNPPDGAILDYYLGIAAREVALEILDEQGETIRRFSSADEPERIDSTQLPHPLYWVRQAQTPSTQPGHHRFVWDLRHEPPPGARRSYSIAAVYGRTPSGPHGPFVHPGEYTVRLTVDGRTYEKPVTVRLDPQVDIHPAHLRLQTDLSMTCYRGYLAAQEIRDAIDELLAGKKGAMAADRRKSLESLRGSGAPDEPDLLYGSIYARALESETIVGIQEKFLYLLNLLQGADAKPTEQAISGVRLLEKTLEDLGRRWKELQ
jgi:hypothetical protein